MKNAKGGTPRQVAIGDLDPASAAHRLRTPLTAIMGFADLLEVTDDRETLLEYVRIIRKNAELLNTMLAELLEAKKPGPPKRKA